MSLAIAVITPSLPSRAEMLGEACESVARQTLQPREHLIGVDWGRRGSAYMRNQLVAASRHSDWIAFLDDDDLMWPHHLERLAEETLAGADIVYSNCDGPAVVRAFDPEALGIGNFIPATVLMRRSLFRSLNGFMPSSAVAQGWEDWDLWKRALAAGARFAYVPQKTWVYRMHAGSKTNVGEALAA